MWVHLGVEPLRSLGVLCPTRDRFIVQSFGVLCPTYDSFYTTYKQYTCVLLTSWCTPRSQPPRHPCQGLGLAASPSHELENITPKLG